MMLVGKSNMETTQKEKSVVMRFLAHPGVSVVSVISTVVSVPLAFYFYFAGIRSPDLTFYFHPVRSMIVPPGVPGALTVSYGGKELKGSILAIQCALWNSGSAPIKRDDILERVHLTAEEGVRILEVTERQRSRDSTGFSIDTAKLSDGEVGFDWKILEQNDGAAIQILYEGVPDAKFAFHGAVVGQRALRQTEGYLIKPPEEELRRFRQFDRFLSYFAFLLAVLMLGLAIYSRIKRPTRQTSFLLRALSSEWRLFVIMIVYGCLMLGIAGLVFYKMWWKPTPFEF